MDVYVIYPVMCVDIYVISLFVLMESKKPKKYHFPLFAECRDHGCRHIIVGSPPRGVPVVVDYR